jgi:hypothetical protein
MRLGLTRQGRECARSCETLTSVQELRAALSFTAGGARHSLLPSRDWYRPPVSSFQLRVAP